MSRGWLIHKQKCFQFMLETRRVHVLSKMQWRATYCFCYVFFFVCSRIIFAAVSRVCSYACVQWCCSRLSRIRGSTVDTGLWSSPCLHRTNPRKTSISWSVFPANVATSSLCLELWDCLWETRADNKGTGQNTYIGWPRKKWHLFCTH